MNRRNFLSKLGLTTAVVGAATVAANLPVAAPSTCAPEIAPPSEAPIPGALKVEDLKGHLIVARKGGPEAIMPDAEALAHAEKLAASFQSLPWKTVAPTLDVARHQVAALLANAQLTNTEAEYWFSHITNAEQQGDTNNGWWLSRVNFALADKREAAYKIDRRKREAQRNARRDADQAALRERGRSSFYEALSMSHARNRSELDQHAQKYLLATDAQLYHDYMKTRAMEDLERSIHAKGLPVTVPPKAFSIEPKFPPFVAPKVTYPAMPNARALAVRRSVVPRGLRPRKGFKAYLEADAAIASLVKA